MPRFNHPKFRKRALPGAFTLAEILVAMVILTILVGIITKTTSSVMMTTTRSSAKIDAFASARSGFDIVSRRLAQATLNTYWSYDNPLAPTVYRRDSDLQFLVRTNKQNSGYGQELYFVSPEAYSADSAVRSTSGLNNGCGFFVQYGGNDSFRPGTSSNERFRYRLMQGMQPTEKGKIYNNIATSSSDGWIAEIANQGGAPAVTGTYVTPLADNVIALVVWPRLSKADDSTRSSLSSDYQYDSKLNATNVPQPATANQLPPMVQITMVIISEASALRINLDSGTPPPEIEEALEGRFEEVAQYDSDLEAVSTALVKNHIEFEIFTTSVPLKESKWSDVWK